VRVFVAGGTGAIGRRLLPQLVAAGHEVTATTQSPEKASLLSSLGATPAVLNALDEAAVLAAVTAARPDVVMNQLTALPPKFEPRKLAPWYEQTSRLRVEGTRHLLSAAREVGAKRLVYQSISFMYALRGPRVLDEDAPLATDAPEPFGTTVRGTAEGERLATQTEGIEGVVLRYGQLYGPGTYYEAQGYFGGAARKRRLPSVGRGDGVFSFLHVDDAASAAVCALKWGRGVYNVVDDEPAPMREWVPVFCAAVGAPRPLRVPVWLARLLGGGFVATTAVESRGATNARAKAELGWVPRWPSWRQGFFAEDPGRGP
jgi:nucleoside-diphosphate-sugar epimerase